MDNNNDVVIINLDRPRQLRFGHKALKMIEKLTGKEADELNVGSGMEDVEKIMYSGLLADAKENDETLKLEDMEDLLDKANPYSEVLDKMQKALGFAYGSFANFEAGKNSQGIAAGK